MNPQVQVRTVDTHCHLFLVEQQAAVVVEAARVAGVAKIVNVGIDARSSLQALTQARGLQGVVATAGLHPHEATSLDPAARVELESLTLDPLVVAVGETGLDFFRMLSPQGAQEDNLRFHCELARATGKPMVIHIRDAWERTLAILEEEAPPSVVIHCFSGDVALARECVARGYLCSFAGPVTYPKNDALRDAALEVPLEHLLVETDSPYLSPQSRRGRDNEPANAMLTLEYLASLRGEPLETLAEATWDNAHRVFGALSDV
jgi:TatD DNase family protein